MTTVREVVESLNKFETTKDLEEFFLKEGIKAPQDGGTQKCLVAKYIRQRAQDQFLSVGYSGTYTVPPEPGAWSTFNTDSKVPHSEVLEGFIEVFDLGGLDIRLYEGERHYEVVQEDPGD